MRVARTAGVIAVALVASVIAWCTPAVAVTIGPDGYGNWVFDASDATNGPLDDDDPWIARLIINGRGSCYLDDDGTCLFEPGLTEGARYSAVLDEMGGGYWWCSIYNSDGCSWIEDYAFKHEYLFTYSGQRQKLTPYYAPVKIAIRKKKARNPHRWIVTCAVTRDGRPFAGKGVGLQWRDRKHPRWHDFGGSDWIANRSGKASGWVKWSGIKGSIRCTTDADWHSRAGASRAVRIWTR